MPEALTLKEAAYPPVHTSRARRRYDATRTDRASEYCPYKGECPITAFRPAETSSTAYGATKFLMPPHRQSEYWRFTGPFAAIEVDKG